MAITPAGQWYDMPFFRYKNFAKTLLTSYPAKRIITSNLVGQDQRTKKGQDVKAKKTKKSKRNWADRIGESITFRDKDNKLRRGTVRIKRVSCGKLNCTKCPHKQYAYAQYRVGRKVTEKYLGIARGQT